MNSNQIVSLAVAVWVAKLIALFWIVCGICDLTHANLGPHFMLKCLCITALVEFARWVYSFKITLQV